MTLPVNGYAAHAFHEQLPKGKASGNLKVSDSAIEFVSGEYSVRMPLRGLQLNMGGARQRLVFLSHPDFADWSIYTSDQRLLKHPALQMQTSVQQQVKQSQRVRHLNWAVLILVLSLLVLAPVMLVMQWGAVTASVAEQVPAEWEEQLGESTFAQYRTEHPLLESKDSQEALHLLTDPLISAIESDRYQYKLFIVNNSELNAFALPGGYIVINSGLILAADNASEVLGVLAHELAHVNEQHGIRNVISTAGSLVLVQAVLGDASGLLAIIANSAPLFINQGYSRAFETEADTEGLKLLQRAQVDPKGLIQFFEKLLAKEQEQRVLLGEDEDIQELAESALGFLSSHPATQDRIDRLSEQIDIHDGPYLDLDKEFEALQRIVKAFVSE